MKKKENSSFFPQQSKSLNSKIQQQKTGGEKEKRKRDQRVSYIHLLICHHFTSLFLGENLMKHISVASKVLTSKLRRIQALLTTLFNYYFQFNQLDCKLIIFRHQFLSNHPWQCTECSTCKQRELFCECWLCSTLSQM